MTYARLLTCGNSSTGCEDSASIVRRACSSNAGRFSISQRAIPAISRWATPSIHSCLARFRQFADRSSDFISISLSEISEHSSRYSRGGSGGFNWASQRQRRLSSCYVPLRSIHSFV